MHKHMEKFVCVAPCPYYIPRLSWSPLHCKARPAAKEKRLTEKHAKQIQAGSSDSVLEDQVKPAMQELPSMINRAIGSK
jgi:ribonuclease I